ncbi:MAG: histidine kinase, partial [Lachnospiraceae bacterium]|nr:histidine kinase [Lachnospiraceae bacterium]
LEVFRRKAMEKEAPELAMMAVDMGKIFRYSTKGDDFVPFEEELSIVNSYIRIQMTRFQDKLEVYYAVPEEVLKVPVMKMLLQPLVENAIFHGIEPMENGGHVFIGARAEADKVIVTIKDDGIGIEQDRLQGIQKALTNDYYDTKEHVGLLNTQARIKLNYGEDYGLTIDSHVGDGTTVILNLPMQPMEQGNLNDCDKVGETDVSDIDRR